jgi:hypothetical protein
MVVDMKFGILEPTTVEIVVARVVDMRQELTKSPAPDFFLTHRLLYAEVPASIAKRVFEVSNLRIEVFADDPVVELGKRLSVVIFGARVPGVFPSRQSRRLGSAGESTCCYALADADSAIRGPGAIPVVGASERSGRSPVDEECSNPRTTWEVARHSQGREVVSRVLADVLRLHVEHADVVTVRLATETRAGSDRHEIAVFIESDAAAEKEIEVAAAATATAAARANGKEPGILEEERPLLGKADIEATEVDLLGVDFDLSKVGVVRHIQVQAAGHAEFRVDTEVAVHIRFGSRCKIAIR